jgi:hypothetical protein
VRFEVLTAVRMIMFFWVVTPCRLVDRYHVSEKYTVSIFRAKAKMETMFLRNVDVTQ